MNWIYNLIPLLLPLLAQLLEYLAYGFAQMPLVPADLYPTRKKRSLSSCTWVMNLKLQWFSLKWFILLILAASISARMQLLSAISSFVLNAWEAASQLPFSFSWRHHMICFMITRTEKKKKGNPIYLWIITILVSLITFISKSLFIHALVSSVQVLP